MNRTFRLATLAAALAVSFCSTAGATGLLNDSHDTNTTNAPIANGGSSSAKADASALAAAQAAAVAVQGQKQQQGQLQGQQQSNRSSNFNKNLAAGGTASSKSGDVSGAQTLTGITGGNNIAPNQSTTVEGDRYEAPYIPVQSAYSAGLVASNGTCMGSSSGGATGPGFSATFGTTWKDSDCSRRYTAEALKASGRQNAAFGVLCQIEDVRKATPRECAAMDELLGATDKIGDVAAAKDGGYSNSDPYIAARMAKQGK